MSSMTNISESKPFFHFIRKCQEYLLESAFYFLTLDLIHFNHSFYTPQYEDSIVQMVGEGYEDDVTLDNIGSVLVAIDPEKELGNMAEDDVPGEANTSALRKM